MSMCNELSTFHNPMTYRFIVTQGSYVNDKDPADVFHTDHQGRSRPPSL